MTIDQAKQHLRAVMARIWKCQCEHKQPFQEIYDNNLCCVACGVSALGTAIRPTVVLPLDGPLMRAAVELSS